MRIHVVLEISPRVKRLLRVGFPAAVLLVGGVALAGVPHTFNTGDILSAQAINDDFASLDTRVTKLETPDASTPNRLIGAATSIVTASGTYTSTAITDVAGFTTPAIPCEVGDVFVVDLTASTYIAGGTTNVSFLYLSVVDGATSQLNMSFVPSTASLNMVPVVATYTAKSTSITFKAQIANNSNGTIYMSYSNQTIRYLQYRP